MLPRLNRIKKKKDFEVVFKKGASCKNSLFVLKVLKSNYEQSRFGFVVSQKVSKKAVIRNKIRRSMAQVAGTELNKIKQGLDLVFIVLPGANEKNASEIKENFLSILKKSGSYN